ncbi:hypothetical protein JCM8097_003709 [Rhodosporidiobolus ruineniae]
MSNELNPLDSPPALFRIAFPASPSHPDGAHYDLTWEQLTSDSPNLFTRLVEEHNRRGLFVRTDPTLFQFIVQHLSGYSILPLPPLSHMSASNALRNLYSDAVTFELSGLAQLLVPHLGTLFDVDGLRSTCMPTNPFSLEAPSMRAVDGMAMVEFGEGRPAEFRMKDVRMWCGALPGSASSPLLLRFSLPPIILSTLLRALPLDHPPLTSSFTLKTTSNASIDFEGTGAIDARTLWTVVSRADELNAPLPKAVRGCPRRTAVDGTTEHRLLAKEIVVRVLNCTTLPHDLLYPEPPLGFEVCLRGSENYTLSVEQIKADAPNLFTHTLFPLAGQVGCSVLYVDRSPRLFRLVSDHLCGYEIFPLPPVETMAPETVLHNLFLDANFYQLPRLKAKLVAELLKAPLEVEKWTGIDWTGLLQLGRALLPREKEKTTVLVGGEAGRPLVCRVVNQSICLGFDGEYLCGRFTSETTTTLESLVRLVLPAHVTHLPITLDLQPLRRPASCHFSGEPGPSSLNELRKHFNPAVPSHLRSRIVAGCDRSATDTDVALYELRVVEADFVVKVKKATASAAAVETGEKMQAPSVDSGEGVAPPQYSELDGYTCVELVFTGMRLEIDL